MTMTDAETAGDRPTFAFALTMMPRKPPVIHGDERREPEGRGRGQASHYISFTRLLTTGRSS